MTKKINHFYNKLKFEHWPWKLTYFPVLIQYVLYSLWEKNPFYFYSTNPGIETGGLLIESKYGILKKIPKKYLPETKYIELETTTLMKFPFIIKPNYGERGVSVEKITNTKEFEKYKKNNSNNRKYIMQEYINLPYEAGIFYHLIPGEKKGVISSITIKKFLSVNGDGTSTIKELIEQNFRAKDQLERLAQKIDVKKILKKGFCLELEPIGNHNRGTTFIDGTHLLNKKLEETFDELAQHIKGFYYGRFDIRAKNMKELSEGNFKILELNGAKSEPTHIYHTGYSVFKAYKTLFYHWSIMRKIAHKNKIKYPYPTIKQGIKDYQKFKQYH